MDTLLLRLVGPMQSWGVQSHYTVRDTGLEPSKSGVIGLLCAAFGRPREASLEDLASLRMGVRIDREGTLKKDYQVVQDVLNSDSKNTRPSIVTNRYYLADAAFLTGLEGDRDLLIEIQNALKHPTWALYLGRKAFAPSMPVSLEDGLQLDMELDEALQKYGWIIHPGKEKIEQLRVVIDARKGNQIRPDVPISFAKRQFASRRVDNYYIPAPISACREVL